MLQILIKENIVIAVRKDISIKNVNKGYWKLL